MSGDASPAREDGLRTSSGLGWLRSSGERVREAVSLTRAATTAFVDDQAMRLAAAVAFYTVLSVAPLFVIVIAVAGVIWDTQTAQVELMRMLTDVVGPSAASAVRGAVAYTSATQSSGLAAVLGLSALLFGATIAFAQLQDALNEIWNVEARRGAGVVSFVRQRLFSLTLVIGVGALLAVSLAVSAGIAVFVGHLPHGLPGPDVLWRVANLGVFLAVFALLFALIFKAVPDAKVTWRDAWIGACVTALLFALGKELIAIYIGRTAAGSAFGAASSLMVLLLWFYYSTVILFLGAEFTKVYAHSRGRTIEPTSLAVARPAWAVLRRTKALVNVAGRGARALGDAVPAPVRDGLGRTRALLQRTASASRVEPRPPAGCERDWPTLTEHPFARRLVEGTLEPEAWRHFVVQDRWMLLQLCDLAGRAAAEVAHEDDLRAISRGLRIALVIEQRLQTYALADLGLRVVEADEQDPSATAQTYADHLQRWYDGSPPFALGAALASRAAILHALAAELRGRAGSAQGHPFCGWIDTYADPTFGQSARAITPRGMGARLSVLETVTRDTLRCTVELWTEALRAADEAS